MLPSTFPPMMVISHIWRTQSKLFKMPAPGPPPGTCSLGCCPHLTAESVGTNTLCRSVLGQPLGRDFQDRILFEILGPQKCFLLLLRMDHRLKNLSCYCPNWMADPGLPAQDGPSVSRTPRLRFLGLITDSPWGKGAGTEGAGCREVGV